MTHWPTVIAKLEAIVERDRIEMAMCWGKQGFGSAAEAMSRIRRDRADAIGAYLCHYCRMYHLGRQKGAVPSATGYLRMKARESKIRGVSDGRQR